MVLVSCSELTKRKVTTLVKLQSSKSLHQIDHHAGELHYAENKQTLALTDCFLSSWTVYITAEPSWIWRLDTRMISHSNEDAMEQKGSARVCTHTHTFSFFCPHTHSRTQIQELILELCNFEPFLMCGALPIVCCTSCTE